MIRYASLFRRNTEAMAALALACAMAPAVDACGWRRCGRPAVCIWHRQPMPMYPYYCPPMELIPPPVQADYFIVLRQSPDGSATVWEDSFPSQAEAERRVAELLRTGVPARWFGVR
jgi:hypothetical protein